MTDSLKVLIVDDNEVCRKLMSHVVSSIPEIEVADTAINGKVALAKLRYLYIDIVLLDVEMPEMDGVETLENIRKDHPHLSVIMISSAHAGDAEKAVKALELGAIDFVPKLVADNGNSIREFRIRLLTIIGPIQSRKILSKAKNTGKNNSPEKQSEPETTEPNITRFLSKVNVITIASSTGGPNSLIKVIPLLPGNLGVPIFLVQHMPPLMTVSLAASLNEKSQLYVREAENGEKVRSDIVYVAPGGKHMVVQKQLDKNGLSEKIIALTDDPPENSVRPSADVLFRSIANVYEGNILSVIMTGMGSDGLNGVLAMKKEGCYCISQSEDTCVVYGMPRAVDEAGVSDEKISLDILAEKIILLTRGRVPIG